MRANAFPANLNTIEAYAFYQTALKKVNFISSIENIEAYAFANIGKAANNKLAPSLWKITPTLKEINFEDNTNIYYIGKHAFENNILQSLDIPVIEGLTLDEADVEIFIDVFPPAADIQQAEDRFVATTEAKKNKPQQRTCYFDRAKLKKEAAKSRAAEKKQPEKKKKQTLE